VPFTYNLPLPELLPIPGLSAKDLREPLRVARFLVEEGAWIRAGTPVAKVENSRCVIQVSANGPGILSKWLIGKGSIVRPGDLLATVEADGESVPYDRPCSEARLDLKADRW
jgi:pyruvate/2-oxoglutarate dehydrogenase complex dihydrolipoamide acyltransferase (E2) component